MRLPELNDVLAAITRIKGIAHETPVMTSLSINDIADCELFFKCENMQRVGAFKFRGATNAVRNLSNAQSEKGVATHSSGNHAQALALAARMRDIPAYIVMPENSPKVKKDAVRSYGAEITYCKPTLEARESTLEEVIKDTGAVFIHPYNNFDVIAGQATAAFEFLSEIRTADYVITPVGGGGLLGGTSISVKALSPDTKVIGAEPEGADDAKRSFESGEIQPSIDPRTVCDGLLTSLGKMNFEIIKNNVWDILTVGDDIIIEAMKLIWQRMKIIVEPSAAVPLAVVLKNPDIFMNKRIGIILSGGNVDLEKLPLNN
ncbi:MAG: pyridoxal-phosphate dependent enzyme [Candidatus Kapaibacterium sp.]